MASAMRTRVHHVLGAPAQTRFSFQCECGYQSPRRTRLVYLSEVAQHDRTCAAAARYREPATYCVDAGGGLVFTPSRGHAIFLAAYLDGVWWRVLRARQEG